ncbi:hypothetical protein GCM10009775_05270 [Microbacterium aoyamense]|uniref:Uncharacterized protein n=2 Tax=Microbacterium aoyamense TaxID=344166 RepID=A0ABN2P9S5_9MICO
MVADAADPPPRESDALLARRAQILATEHWGLLAARGTAQSEVLTRITIFLTLVSAGLVTIGLLGQATGFAGWFPAAALSILAFLALVGLLTQIRVFNVAEDDMMFVTAMNRLRGAYVDLDPKVEEYFLEATTDDMLGMQVTYSFMVPRGDAKVMGGSSAFLIVIVNACVLGLILGGLVALTDLPVGWAITAGILTGLLVILGSGMSVYRAYLDVWRRYEPRRRMDELPAYLRPRSRSRHSR